MTRCVALAHQSVCLTAELEKAGSPEQRKFIGEQFHELVLSLMADTITYMARVYDIPEGKTTEHMDFAKALYDRATHLGV